MRTIVLALAPSVSIPPPTPPLTLSTASRRFAPPRNATAQWEVERTTGRFWRNARQSQPDTTQSPQLRSVAPPSFAKVFPGANGFE